MSLRLIVTALLVVAGFTCTAPAPVQAASDAAGFVSDLGDRAIKVLTSSQSDAEREQQFRALFDEGFDVPGIARFVLGTYWRTATDQQKDEFQKLFESYIVHSYTVRFSQYSGQQMKVLGSQPQGDAGWLVQSQILAPGGGNQPPVKVDWRVAKTDAGFKITDVLVESVSMAVTERQEFASVIQRGGGQVEALLKLLRERVTAKG